MRTYPGYTLTSLLEEDAEFLRFLAIEQRGTPEGEGDDADG